MNLNYFVLLILTVFASSVMVSSATSYSKTERSLRLRHLWNKGNEERGIASTTSEKIKSWFTSSSEIPMNVLVRWVKKKRSPQDVLTRLGLGNAGQDLFQKSHFKTWVTYMSMLDNNNANVAMVSALKTQYRFTDEVLSDMIIAAKKVPSSEDVATRLQISQLLAWKTVDKSSDDVFKFLQLSKTGNMLFDSPEFPVWIKYVGEASVETVFSTLAIHYTDDALAQLLIAAKTISGTKNIATKLQGEQLRTWLRKQKSADDVFVLLQLNKADDKLFDNPELTIWSNYMDNMMTSHKEATMVSTLSTHYKQDVLSQMIITAKLNSGTEDLATKFQTAQLKRWGNAHIPGDVVFTRLQLNEAGNNLFGIPEFPLWFKYVQDMGGWRNDKMIMLILADHYKENILTQLIVAAKTVSNTEDIATKVQAVQLRMWKSERTSTDNVFNLLQLNKAGKNLFDSPEFSVWIKYTADLGGSSREQLMFSTLSQHYKDDVLSQIIIAAKRVSSTQDIAAKVQEAQLRTWTKARTSIEDVFNFLQLNKAGDKLFADPEFSVWTKYADGFGVLTKDRMMLATLSTHYKEDVLTQLLIAARKNPNTEDLVITLQAEQLRIKYNNRESYGDVFNLLKLNKAGNQLFDNPDFPVWMKYVRRGRVETIFPILSTYYTDDVLAQLFIAAKKISGTENIATKLQAEQLQIWLRKQKSADDVFTLLQLNKVDNKLFDTPEFALWSKYIDDLKISNKESAMLSILKTHYSEEAMIKLVHSRKAPLGMKSTVMGVDGGKVQEWLKAETSPDDVFKAYKLNNAGDDLLISPQLDRWASYVSKFNYENPSKKTAMVDTLTHYYGDENLAQMLIAAKGVVKTESIATDLQIMQIKYWLRMKEDPQLVYNWMGIADRGSDDVERKIFEKFFTKITSLK